MQYLDQEQYSTARHNLNKGIKRAKAAYRIRIEDHFNNRDPAHMWQGIQHITNQRKNKQPPRRSSTTSSHALSQLWGIQQHHYWMLWIPC